MHAYVAHDIVSLVYLMVYQACDLGTYMEWGQWCSWVTNCLSVSTIVTASLGTLAKDVKVSVPQDALQRAHPGGYARRNGR
jgi:hypothetical protein